MADIEFNIDIQNTQNINANFTNSLNINLQKELTMGIELNSPLYIGADTNLQKQVAQNTADITELKSDVAEIGDLDNLTTTDKSSLVGAINEVNTLLPPTSQRDYIDNSKGMPTGAVSSNALILPEIQNYAHSTFDRSKFTVVGSPNITEDGIASGFSDSNYLKGATTFNLSGAKWKITVGVILHSTPVSGYESLWHAYGTGTSYFNSLGCVIGTNGKLILSIKCDGTVLSHSTANAIEINKLYITSIEFTGASYIFKVNDTVIGTYAISTEVEGSTNDKTLWLGAYWVAGYAFSDGAIDLKYTSITVDGVPVFSGNKTGIDTIKPNNWVIPSGITSPTISEDGIASGFGAEQCLATKNLTLSNKLEIITKVFTKRSSSEQRIWSVNGTGNTRNYFSLLLSGSNTIDLRVPNVNNNGYIRVLAQPYNSESNVYVKLVVDGETAYSYISNDGYSWTYCNSVQIYNNLSSLVSNKAIWIGSNGYDISVLRSSFDLNCFKIYIDGDLVYQPCLKIPYTESKTGSKIVNSIYRDRVNDMYEQFGYAPYYTLSDTDFTLPMGEIYGNIQQTLRSSTVSGINQNYLYSDRMQIQTGSCTSGVEVTLPKPFTDSNYALTVPYSAKSATAFTPTATGDWIAIGLGNL